MMYARRLVTRRTVEAFLSGNSLKVDNTETDGITLKLFDNTIAIRQGGELHITNAGWPTMTTHERLNGIFAALKYPLMAYADRKRTIIRNTITGESVTLDNGVWYVLTPAGPVLSPDQRKA